MMRVYLGQNISAKLIGTGLFGLLSSDGHDLGFL